MHFLRSLITIVILLVFLSSCSVLPLYNKKDTPKKRTSITSIAYAAHVILDNKQFIANPPTQSGYSIKKYILEFFGMAALLWILLFYRFHKTNLKRRKQLKLDDAEWALFDLVIDTLGDLRRRLVAKTSKGVKSALDS